jgi:hypothetical protein
MSATMLKLKEESGPEQHLGVRYIRTLICPTYFQIGDDFELDQGE